MQIGEVKQLLSRGYIYVEFVKKDGSLRKMWCTRDNRIVKECGHEIIQFNHSEIKARERRNPHLLYVYDIQEDDTRILNTKTINVDSIKIFSHLGEVEIPSIKTRFEKKKESAKEVSEERLEKDLSKDMDNLLGDTDVDNIFL